MRGVGDKAESETGGLVVRQVQHPRKNGMGVDSRTRSRMGGDGERISFELGAWTVGAAGAEGQVYGSTMDGVLRGMARRGACIPG